MKKHFIIFMPFLYSLSGKAQVDVRPEKKANPYTLNITFTPQLFLNQPNIKNDGVTPEAINTKNTGGIRMGFEIERKSRRNGFVMNLGLTYSIQHQYIGVYFDDPEGRVANALKKYWLDNPIDFSSTSSYMDLHFTAGYIFPIRKLGGWNAVTKAGISMRKYLGVYYIIPYADIDIYVPTSQDVNLGIKGIDMNMGGGGGSYQWEMECYAGLRKEMNYKFLKNISFGIEAGRAVFIANGGSPTARATVKSYYSYNNGEKPILSVDRYLSKDIAIGLKLSAGFWYK